MFTFTREEIEEILTSMFAMALAVMIAHFGLFGIFHTDPITLARFFGAILIALGTGFVFHELAHKFVAQSMGARAGFRMWTQGILFMFVFAVLFRVIFAAPGAVYIYTPYLSRRQNGLISIAGPLTNIALAVVFLILLFFSFFAGSTFLLEVASLGFMINAWLAVFNLLPIYPLDGSKVMAWDFRIWLGTFIIALLLMVPMWI